MDSHDRALHHEGIMYGIRIMALRIPFPGMSVRTMSQAMIDPSGTEISVTKKPIISECSSGSQKTVFVSGLASRYFQ